MARRQHLTLMVVCAVAFFIFLTYTLAPSPTDRRLPQKELLKQADDKTNIAQEAEKGDFGLSSSILTGGAIAPKLGNETAK